jgi:hypothetical protein
MTGIVNFTDNERKEFALDVIHLSKDGSKKIATWNKFTRVKGILTNEESMKSQAERFKDKVFKVVSRQGRPYLDFKKPKENEVLKGNDRFEGYAVDLIKHIMDEHNFTFEFKLAEDGEYGSYDKNAKRWNGIIGELLDGVKIVLINAISDYVY